MYHKNEIESQEEEGESINEAVTNTFHEDIDEIMHEDNLSSLDYCSNNNEEDIEFEYESDGDYIAEAKEDEQNSDEKSVNFLYIDIENTFYEAEDYLITHPSVALEKYKKVLEKSCNFRGDKKKRIDLLIFKATQNIVILAAREGDYSLMLNSFTNLLELMKNVTQNEAAEAINSILDYLSNLHYKLDCAEDSSLNNAGKINNNKIVKSKEIQNKEKEKKLEFFTGVLQDIYSLTLAALKKNNNQRLCFNTIVKLCKLFLKKQQVKEAEDMLKELRYFCLLEKQNTSLNQDNSSQASNLIQLYALEVQLCDIKKSYNEMKSVITEATKITNAIADPRSIAVIREFSGKLFMKENHFKNAYNEFFESFKNYQETGNSIRAKVLLKYVVFANILSLSDINPFDSQEANVYQEDSEVMVLKKLRIAYEKDDISTVEKICRGDDLNINVEEFLKSLVPKLLRNTCLKALEKAILPYSSISLDTLADQVGLDKSELKTILVKFILEDRIHGSIDDISGFLELEEKKETEMNTSLLDNYVKWSGSLKNINNILVKKMNEYCK